MTAADMWVFMPLCILGVGLLAILLTGVFSSLRSGTVIGAAATLVAALLVLLSPHAPQSQFLGIAATPFAKFFTVLFCLTATVTLLLSHDYNRRRGILGEEYPATVVFATFGMVVTATSTNLLNLFLGLEGLTFAFYILTAIDRKSAESSEAGLKYLLQGAVSAAFIAFGLALIYTGTGTLNIAGAMSMVANGAAYAPFAYAGWGFLLVGLAFKISLVPAHFWTPDVYQGAPAPVTAFLSTGSKTAGFVALLILFGPLGGGGMAPLRTPLWWLCLLSMILGNLAALQQRSLKRMLGYSSIAQMGYITLALLTGSRDGFSSVGFYLVAYTAMNLSAFGAVAAVSGEKEIELIDDYRGFGYARPLQGGVLALAMFALAGIPPTAGFMGKFAIFSAALSGKEPGLAVVGIITAAVSVFYYLRVVAALYMHEPAAIIEHGNKASAPEAAALIATSAVVLFLGVFPTPLFDVIEMVIR